MNTQSSVEKIAQIFHSARGDSSLVEQIIRATKDYLEADVVFLAQFEGDRKVIRRTIGDGDSVGLVDGSSFPLESTYCHRVVSGNLPNIIADAANDARVKELPITSELKIGSYIGVPVTFPDERIFGTLCCVNHQPDTTLNHRDGKFMRVLARLIGNQLYREEVAEEERRLKTERIQSLFQGQGLRMVFQPIVDLATGEIVGAEALTRFDAEPKRSPDIWFKEAVEVGLGVDLEILAIQTAIEHLNDMPKGVYLTMNVAPETLVSGAFGRCIDNVPSDNLVIELTEHAIVGDYDLFLDAVRRVRNKGLRIALDDVGAGYSGLVLCFRVAPDIVKLDRALIQGISNDVVKQKLAKATASLADSVPFTLVAEGIETAEDAEALRALGVPYGQGYYFSRPEPLPLKVQMNEQPSK